MATFEIIRRSGLSFTVMVDDEDYDLVLRAGPWHIIPSDGTTYVFRNMRDGADSGWRSQSLHRFLIATDAECVDHVNGNGLDNRRCNLRPATRSQNKANSRRHANNASGFKGVTRRSHGCWNARIRVDGKLISLGCFPSPELAHYAYIRAAAEFFGDFSRAL